MTFAHRSRVTAQTSPTFDDVYTHYSIDAIANDRDLRKIALDHEATDNEMVKWQVKIMNARLKQQNKKLEEAAAVLKSMLETVKTMKEGHTVQLESLQQRIQQQRQTIKELQDERDDLTMKELQIGKERK